MKVLIVALCAGATMLAAACGGAGSGPTSMDPETKAEYEAKQVDLKDLFDKVRVMSIWTIDDNGALEHMDEFGSMTSQQKRELGFFIGEWKQLWSDARDCSIFFGAANQVYGGLDAEEALARACWQSIEEFAPIAAALLEERTPTKAEFSKFADATTAAWGQANKLGYLEEE